MVLPGWEDILVVVVVYSERSERPLSVLSEVRILQSCEEGEQKESNWKGKIVIEP